MEQPQRTKRRLRVPCGSGHKRDPVARGVSVLAHPSVLSPDAVRQVNERLLRFRKISSSPPANDTVPDTFVLGCWWTIPDLSCVFNDHSNTIMELRGRPRTSVRPTEKPGVDSSILSLGTTISAPGSRVWGRDEFAVLLVKAGVDGARLVAQDLVREFRHKAESCDDTQRVARLGSQWRPIAQSEGALLPSASFSARSSLPSRSTPPG